LANRSDRRICQPALRLQRQRQTSDLGCLASVHLLGASIRVKGPGLLTATTPKDTDRVSRFDLKHGRYQFGLSSAAACSDDGMEGLRIEQEPSAIPDRCSSITKDLEPLRDRDGHFAGEMPPLRRLAMAACLPKPDLSQREVRFKCAQCHHQEAGRLQGSGSGQRLTVRGAP
jgi:hypothetical protein